MRTILLMVVLFASSVSAADKPNVLFVMSDQHNAHFMGVAGHAAVKTPTLDAMAKDGTYFPNAFCQTAQCCPARYTLFTGRYARSHGCRWNGVKEPLLETTIAEVLKQQGYATATFGKHHMQHSPTEHGFDVVVNMDQYTDFMKQEKMKSWLQQVDQNRGHPLKAVGRTKVDNDHHPAGFWTNNAMDFIQKNANKPFCIWLSYYGPHTPIVCSNPWADMYKASDMQLPPNHGSRINDAPPLYGEGQNRFRDMTDLHHQQALAAYAGYVSQIDANIGRVLDLLKELKLEKNTIVVYTADHGEYASEHSMWTKPTMNLDAVVRVPMIVKFPGVVPRGNVRQELVGSIDLMPTLLDLAGVDIPKQVQGVSMVPLFADNPESWRNVIFSEIGYPGKPRGGRNVMARTHTHKYVHYENGGEPMEALFDLQADPWETHNVLADAAYTETLAELRSAFQAWESTTERAPMYPVEPQTKHLRKAK
ncbi:sulfatase family protein [Novipirellula artificiosorum]|uniref:Arylsulfatase n=1 Tax=Novipirellula artificiosorum TaxID=2528016 RepID=A0A5C6DUJ8_9BACT|nr:sulfatase-like hydrolase/transferase [Novipirellula artificiosorum]TWU40388.1 Arylsulfatase [Novipirellula artificiosorum]